MRNIILDVSSVVICLSLVISLTIYTTALPHSRSLRGVSLPFAATDLYTLPHRFSSVMVVTRRAHMEGNGSEHPTPCSQGKKEILLKY